jgi:hypothetical protein
MLRPLAGVRPDFAAGERARDKRGPPIPVAEMGQAPAAETLLGCLALSREPRTARQRADRGRAMRRHPRRPPQLHLVRPSRSRRPRNPRRRPRPDLQGLSDRRLQEPLLLFSRQRGAPRAARARRGGDRRLEPGGDRAPARGHDLRGDRRRHGTEHDRCARGALARAEDALFESAADANPAGDRYAARHQEIAEQIGVPFERLRPPIEGGDWNDVLKASIHGDRRHEA